MHEVDDLSQTCYLRCAGIPSANLSFWVLAIGGSTEMRLIQRNEVAKLVLNRGVSHR
jgi:hypothetical protein